MKNEILFQQKQQELLWLINLDAGRDLLGIKEKEPIIKVTPNSYHLLLGWINKTDVLVKEAFFCYEKFAKHLLPFLTYEDILRKDYPTSQIVGLREKYEAFLHFNNFKRSPKFPQLYLQDSIFSSAGDGAIQVVGTNWTTERDNTTGDTANSGGGGSLVRVQVQGTTPDPGNYYITRGFIPFDTSSLKDSIDIKTADLRLYSDTKTDDLGGDVVLAKTTQNAIGSLVVGDYDNITKNSPTELASRQDITNIVTGQYSTFALNSDGIGFIDAAGNTKFGIRHSHDVDNTDPGAGNGATSYYFESEEAGTDKDPYLQVFYAVIGKEISVPNTNFKRKVEVVGY